MWFFIEVGSLKICVLSFLASRLTKLSIQHLLEFEFQLKNAYFFTVCHDILVS